MIIGLEGFGSVWSVRGGLKPERTAFYNTTGIITGGKLWIHNAPVADLGFVLGGTEPDQRVGNNVLQPERFRRARNYRVETRGRRAYIKDTHRGEPG